MKKCYLFILICLSFAACKSQDKDHNTSKDSSDSGKKAELEKKISKRDYSITAANAYNDIFLDSMAMEEFIAQSKPDDKVIRRMRSFYNARNYQFAWFSKSGLSEQARGFWNLQSYYTTVNQNKDSSYKILAAKMQSIETAENLNVNPSDKGILKAEFLLTQHFIEYILDNYEDGVVKRKELERFIPLTKSNPLKLADSLLTKKHKDNRYYEEQNSAYKGLKNALQGYLEVANKGGWPVVKNKTDYIALKNRLRSYGIAPTDTLNSMTPDLSTAIRSFQTSLGLTADGVVSESLIKDLNVPVTKRIQQLLINMDRMRWMPEPEGNLIMVNIPEFKLHVYEGAKKAFEMNVVVGKEGHNTMMFKGDLSQVVFSPYWNVTPDIIREEIVPAMNRNPNYLASHNMEIIGNSGGLPVVRQLPGPENSLGKVKFLFPNSFNIYFHDTPAKSLFSKDKRAFSHGCIRLSDPTKMAEYILRNTPGWDPVKISEAMNSGKEQFVKLKQSVPVIITYYTAWVDENGLVNFRDDIYKHDEELAAKMFTLN